MARIARGFANHQNRRPEALGRIASEKYCRMQAKTKNHNSPRAQGKLLPQQCWGMFAPQLQSKNCYKSPWEIHVINPEDRKDVLLQPALAFISFVTLNLVQNIEST